MSAADDDDERQYEVGYRRPPAAHRFRPGESGNPSGSKRKPSSKGQGKNLRAELLDELGERVAVSENGRRRHMARQTALIKKLIADALSGDARAREQLFRLANQAEANPDTAHAEDLIGAAKDAEILERFRTEIIEKYKETKDDD